MLFARSIEDNIRIGRPDASDADIAAAMEAAQSAEFIGRQGDGLATVIGERGRTLSGGERQRLSIARALIKDPPIMILDEATAALDAGTEKKLQAALDQLRKGRTTFIIAHPLGTVRNADRIIVFDQGRIVESGSFVGLGCEKRRLRGTGAGAVSGGVTKRGARAIDWQFRLAALRARHVCDRSRKTRAFPMAEARPRVGAIGGFLHRQSPARNFPAAGRTLHAGKPARGFPALRHLHRNRRLHGGDADLTGGDEMAAEAAAVMPLFSGVFVFVFGALTLWLHDDTFIKMKPTIVNGIFAAALLGMLALGKSLLPYVLDAVFQLDDAGGRSSPFVGGSFHFPRCAERGCLANFSSEFWAGFKVWGVMPITMIFALAQTPLIMRHDQSGAFSDKTAEK